jgi:hypothetical protein
LLNVRGSSPRLEDVGRSDDRSFLLQETAMTTIPIQKVQHPHMDATQKFVAAMLVSAGFLAVIAFVLVNLL